MHVFNPLNSLCNPFYVIIFCTDGICVCLSGSTSALLLTQFIPKKWSEWVTTIFIMHVHIRAVGPPPNQQQAVSRCVALFYRGPQSNPEHWCMHQLFSSSINIISTRITLPDIIERYFCPDSDSPFEPRSKFSDVDQHIFVSVFVLCNFYMSRSRMQEYERSHASQSLCCAQSCEQEQKQKKDVLNCQIIAALFVQ